VLDGRPQTPIEFTAEAVNVTKENVRKLTEQPNGTPRNLDFEQAAAAAQVQAINGVAAALLAIADAIRHRPAH